jgi:hypothetical protein
MRSIILFLFAVGVLLLAHWAMPRIVGGLRRMSRLPEKRIAFDLFHKHADAIYAAAARLLDERPNGDLTITAEDRQ